MESMFFGYIQVLQVLEKPRNTQKCLSSNNSSYTKVHKMCLRTVLNTLSSNNSICIWTLRKPEPLFGVHLGGGHRDQSTNLTQYERFVDLPTLQCVSIASIFSTEGQYLPLLLWEWSVGGHISLAHTGPPKSWNGGSLFTTVLPGSRQIAPDNPWEESALLHTL